MSVLHNHLIWIVQQKHIGPNFLLHWLLPADNGRCLQGLPIAANHKSSSQDDDTAAPGSLQSHQLSPSQPVLQASSYMSGMEEKDRLHLAALVDTAIIKVSDIFPISQNPCFVKVHDFVIGCAGNCEHSMWKVWFI